MEHSEIAQDAAPPSGPGRFGVPLEWKGDWDTVGKEMRPKTGD